MFIRGGQAKDIRLRAGCAPTAWQPWRGARGQPAAPQCRLLSRAMQRGPPGSRRNPQKARGDSVGSGSSIHKRRLPGAGPLCARRRVCGPLRGGRCSETTRLWTWAVATQPLPGGACRPHRRALGRAGLPPGPLQRRDPTPHAPHPRLEEVTLERSCFVLFVLPVRLRQAGHLEAGKLCKLVVRGASTGVCAQSARASRAAPRTPSASSSPS